MSVAELTKGISEKRRIRLENLPCAGFQQRADKVGADKSLLTQILELLGQTPALTVRRDGLSLPPPQP